MVVVVWCSGGVVVVVVVWCSGGGVHICLCS